MNSNHENALVNAEGKALAIAKRYGANRQAAIWASAAFLALGGAVVALSFWAFDPSRRLQYHPGARTRQNAGEVGTEASVVDDRLGRAAVDGISDRRRPRISRRNDERGGKNRRDLSQAAHRRPATH